MIQRCMPESATDQTKPVISQYLGFDFGEQRIGVAVGQSKTLTASPFAKHLRRRYQLPVHMVDERYTSNEASRIIADNRQQQNRRKAKREDSDTIAAALILEQWLHEPTREN